jgi:glycosyltransferase involved in cell wall biosynthesis
MPTYNSGRLLRNSIRSVFRQTFKDWELIIVDNASTNDAPVVLREFMARDPRIKLVFKDRNDFNESGISDSLNRGIDLARGQYIARLDDDDAWLDERKLEKQVAFMDAHPDCVVVGGGVIVVDPEGKELFRYFKKEIDAEIRRTALFANPFSHTTVLFRAETARAAGEYRGKHIEDWDLWLRLGQLGTFYNFKEYFTAYTMTGQNSSFLHQKPLTRRILSLIWRERKHYPGFLKAYAVNLAQYLYVRLPLPLSLRTRLHSFLAGIKRRTF